MTGWRTDEVIQSDGSVHVWPDADFIEHDLNGDRCVCGPRVEPVAPVGAFCWVIVHNSLDGRELGATE